MAIEDDSSAPKLRSPAAEQPPPLRKPLSSGTKLTLIGGSIVALVTGYSVISNGGGGGEPPPVDAGAVVNTTVNESGGGETLHPPYDVIDQTGARVRTKFGPDWSATVSGRQVLFSDPSNRIACQSLVLPIAEYTGIMNQFSEGIGQYSDELAHATGERIGAAITTVSREDLAPEGSETGAAGWKGAKVVLDYSSGSRTVRRAIYAASSTTGSHGAMLTCTSDDSRETAQIMERDVRAYRLEPTS